MNMFVLLLAFIGFLGGAHAQNSLVALPPCAFSCVSMSAASSPCSVSDIGCICANDQLMERIDRCTTANCTVRLTLTAQNITSAACGAPVHDSSNVILIVATVFGSLAFLCVMFRIINRITHYADSFRADDAFIVLAGLALVPVVAFQIRMSNKGLGKDAWTMPFPEIDEMLKYFYLSEILYITITTSTRLSMLAFFHHVFNPHSMSKGTKVTGLLCICYFLTFISTTIFQCFPLASAWQNWDGEHPGRCIDFNAAGWATAVVNIILDAIVVALPVPKVLKLSLSRVKKIQIVVMFSFGFFVTIISIVRLQTLVKVQRSRNVSWDYLPVSYWSCIELSVGIMCACLPAVRQLMGRIFPRYFGTSTPHGTYSAYNTRVNSVAIPKNISITISALPKPGDPDIFPLVGLDKTAH